VISSAPSFFFSHFGVLMPKGEKNLSTYGVDRFYLGLACKTIIMYVLAMWTWFLKQLWCVLVRILIMACGLYGSYFIYLVSYCGVHGYSLVLCDLMIFCAYCLSRIPITMLTHA
jgi:hypothetical protein